MKYLTLNEKLKLKDAVKQGYIEIDEYPAVADLSFPTSKTRRGRVQNGGAICPTIMTSSALYVFENV